MSYAWLGPVIVRRVRDAIILAYRRAFASDPKFTYVQNFDGPVTPEYPGGSPGTVNFDCSKIVINDATAQDYYALPSITVQTLSGEEHRFIQEDHFETFIDSNGETSARRGAPLSITATIEATSLDVITRDELVDRMYETLKIVTTDLADRGVGIWKTSISADRKEYKNDRWFYTSGVVLHLYAEWIDEDITDPNSTLTGVYSHIKTDHGVDQEFKLDI